MAPDGAALSLWTCDGQVVCGQDQSLAGSAAGIWDYSFLQLSLAYLD